MYTPIVHYPMPPSAYTKRIPPVSHSSYPPNSSLQAWSLALVLTCSCAHKSSKGFDLMPDDFSYAQLLLMAGLSSGSAGPLCAQEKTCQDVGVR